MYIQSLFHFPFVLCCSKIKVHLIKNPETLLQPHCYRHETQRTLQQSPLSVPLPPQTALKPCCYVAPWRTSKTATQTPRSAVYGVRWRKTALISQRQRHWHRGQWRCVHGSLAIYNRTPTSAEVLNSLKLPPRLAFHGIQSRLCCGWTHSLAVLLAFHGDPTTAA